MKIIKKSGLALLLLSLLLIVYVAGRNDAPGPAVFTELQQGDVAVFKLTMRDGTTGEAVSTSDGEKIEQFIALMEDVLFIKKDDQEQRLGWSYTVDLHTEEKGYHRITFLGGQTAHFSAVNTAGHYRVKKTPYYKMDRNLLAELEQFYIFLEQNEAVEGGGGSENNSIHYNLQLALDLF